MLLVSSHVPPTAGPLHLAVGVPRRYPGRAWATSPRAARSTRSVVIGRSCPISSLATHPLGFSRKRGLEYGGPLQPRSLPWSLGGRLGLMWRGLRSRQIGQSANQNLARPLPTYPLIDGQRSRTGRESAFGSVFHWIYTGLPINPLGPVPPPWPREPNPSASPRAP